MRRIFALLSITPAFFGCHLDTQRAIDAEGGHTDSLGVEVANVLCQRYVSEQSEEDIAAGTPHDVMGLRWKAVCRTGDLSLISEDAPEGLHIFLRHRQRLIDAVDRVLPASMQDPLASLLGRMLPLYDPPSELLPKSNRELGRLVALIRDDQESLDALYRIGQRDGYRPLPHGLGAIRPTLLYPGFDNLAELGLRVVSPEGVAENEYREVLRALALELAYLEPEELKPTEDQTTAEFLRTLLYRTDPEFRGTTGPIWVLGRDRRGLALPNRQASTPFIDTNGDGRFDTDLDIGRPEATGRYVDATGSALDIPPFATQPEDAPLVPPTRDAQGRAVDANGVPLFEYIDADQTMLAALVREGQRLFRQTPSPAFQVGQALPALMGPQVDSRVDTYGFDDQVAATLQFTGADLDRSPVMDFLYAAIELLPRDGTNRVLELVEEGIKPEHEPYLAAVAASIELMLRHKPMYPNAQIVDSVSLYDDLLEVLEEFASADGLIEELLRSQLDPQSLQAAPVLAAMMRNRDEDIDYDPAPPPLFAGIPDLPYNRAPLGATVGEMTMPVDRSQPDVEGNESIFGRTLALIDGFNGARLCNQAGAEILAPALPIFGDLLTLRLPVREDAPRNCADAVVYVFEQSLVRPTNTVGECELVDIPNVTEAFTLAILNQYDFVLSHEPSQHIIDCLAEQLGGQIVDDSFQATFKIAGLTRRPTAESFARMLFWGLDRGPLGNVNCPACAGLFGENVTDKYGNEVVSRYGGTIFAMETPGFYEGLRPLLEVLHRPEFIHDGEGRYRFGRLMSALYSNWGSARHWRATSQTGQSEGLRLNNIASYEPPIAEALGTGAGEGKLLDRLHALNTHMLPLRFGDDRSYDTIDVLSEAAVDMVSSSAPANRGLTTRQNSPVIQSSGRTFGVTPLRLFFQGSGGMDEGLNADPAGSAAYFEGRDAIADMYWSTEGDDATGFQFRNRREVAIIRQIVPFLRDEYEKHRQRGDLAVWADDLYSDAEDILASALGSAVVRFLDAAYDDQEANDALANYLGYMMDETTEGGEPFIGLVTDAADILSIIDDSENLMPLAHVLSEAFALGARDATSGDDLDVQSSLAGVGVALLSGIQEADTDDTMQVILENLMVYWSPDQPFETELENMMEILKDVHREDPDATGDLSLSDYRTIMSTGSTFMSSCDRGLERLFRVLSRHDLSTYRFIDPALDTSPCPE